jgi:hypothetical protein
MFNVLEDAAAEDGEVLLAVADDAADKVVEVAQAIGALTALSKFAALDAVDALNAVVALASALEPPHHTKGIGTLSMLDPPSLSARCTEF